MSLKLSLPRLTVSGSLNFSTSPSQKASRTYVSNGRVMNSNGFLANPSRQAQIQARNAGALTNAEAQRIGLTNIRPRI